MTSAGREGVAIVQIPATKKRGALASALVIALVAPFAVAQASTFKVLHSFSGSDGAYPNNLIMDEDGNLYGTTGFGGSNGAGTVFKLAPDGTETVLHSFAEGSDGFGPDGLIMDTNGNLWGTACCGGNAGGCGVLFKLTPKGRETLVHTLAGPPTDGCSPIAALIIGGNGNFYGTTTGGGKNRAGTVFELAPDGSESVLHSFNINHGGFYPYAGLLADANGNLYGADSDGGRKDDGAVFKIAPDDVETVLHTFKGSPSDGSNPVGTPIMDASGNIYGTTLGGGRAGCYADFGCGIVFKLASDGTETVLHYFKGGRGDGSNSTAGLIADSAGTLYGTTEYGGGYNSCEGTGNYGCGTVFEIAPDGTETVLRSFGNGSKGANPVAGLVANGKGNFYGAASDGGAYGYGTVFEITP